MSYVEDAREALRIRLPGIQEDLLDLYTLLVFTRGDETTLEDVHDAWSVWRHRTDPEHRSIIPFSGLTREVQELDRKYAEAIRLTARFLCTGDATCSCECEGCRHHCAAHTGAPCSRHPQAPVIGGRCGLCPVEIEETRK